MKHIQTVEDSFFEDWNKILQKNLKDHIHFVINGGPESFDEYKLFVGKISEIQRVIGQTTDLLNKYYPEKPHILT